MNIKQHIEAGHYPVDAKGRALVPMRNSGPGAVIYATDRDHSHCIVGHQLDNLYCWQPDGRADNTVFSSDDEYPTTNLDLLPPPPHKSVHKSWIVYPRASDGHPCWGSPKFVYDNPHEPATHYPSPKYIIIEMSCEYEEPWS